MFKVAEFGAIDFIELDHYVNLFALFTVLCCRSSRDIRADFLPDGCDVETKIIEAFAVYHDINLGKPVLQTDAWLGYVLLRFFGKEVAYRYRRCAGFVQVFGLNLYLYRLTAAADTTSPTGGDVEGCSGEFSQVGTEFILDLLLIV